jgi:4-aminobutyrate--pyruvate transaminase
MALTSANSVVGNRGLPDYAELATLDVANIVHPQTNARIHLEQGPKIIVGSEGSRVFDQDGKDYIDCIAAMWCCPLGFKSERLAKVAYEQLRTFGGYHIYKHHSHEPVIRLAEKLLSTAPSFMSKVIFQNSGSEANEVALKLCWYYHHAIGKPERKKIIGRKGGFHGQTTATSSMSGRDEFHRGFGLPVDSRFVFTELPHYYRLHEQGETEEQFSDRMARSLEDLILAEGPETIAAMFAEPVMGGGGGLFAPNTYFEKIQRVLRKYDILFVADEVITGIGRTGNWWASQTFDLQPDIITSAKGLGAGMLPIGAVIINDRILQGILTMSDKLGVYAQGSTFSGNPTCTAVALETLKIIEEEGLIENGRALGRYFLGQVTGSNDHPMFADVRSVGAIVSLEIMADRDGRRPFDPAVNILGVLNRHCNAERVLVRLNSNRIIFAPPLNMTMDEASEAASRFRRAVDAAWREVHAK